MGRKAGAKVPPSCSSEDEQRNERRLARWLDSYASVSTEIDKHGDLEELVDTHGGLVRIRNFLPSWVAEAILARLQRLPSSSWNDTSAEQDYTHNNISHSFVSSKAPGPLEPLFRMMSLLRPGCLHSFSAARYQGGDHIAPHDDRAYTQVLMEDGTTALCSRSIAVIYYLTKDWAPDMGGQLIDLEASQGGEQQRDAHVQSPGGEGGEAHVQQQQQRRRMGSSPSSSPSCSSDGGSPTTRGDAVADAAAVLQQQQQRRRRQQQSHGKRRRGDGADVSFKPEGGSSDDEGGRVGGRSEGPATEKVAAVLTPEFNSVVAFRIPRYHSVTPVTADRPRYSLFGWFLEEGRLYDLYTGEGEEQQQRQQAEGRQLQQAAEAAAAAAVAGPERNQPKNKKRRKKKNDRMLQQEEIQDVQQQQQRVQERTEERGKSKGKKRRQQQQKRQQEGDA